MTHVALVAALAGLVGLGPILSLAAAPAGGGVDPGLWQAAGVTPAVPPVAAPGFELPDLAGRPVTLQALRGRLVMLYFWATW